MARSFRIQGSVSSQARIVAHETDHLSGTLYLDRAALRSLTTNVNYTRHWAAPAPDAARAALGF